MTNKRPECTINPIVLPSLKFVLSEIWTFEFAVDPDDGSISFSKEGEHLASTDATELGHLIEALQKFHAALEDRELALEEEAGGL